jgi:hypothetical protein
VRIIGSSVRDCVKIHTNPFESQSSFLEACSFMEATPDRLCRELNATGGLRVDCRCDLLDLIQKLCRVGKRTFSIPVSLRLSSFSTSTVYRTLASPDPDLIICISLFSPFYHHSIASPSSHQRCFVALIALDNRQPNIQGLVSMRLLQLCRCYLPIGHLK